MKSRNIRNTFAVTACVALSMITACKEDPTAPPVVNEHPPATTITIRLTRLDAGGNPTTDTSSATIRDTTVVKNKPSAVGELAIEAGSTYAAAVTLLDESKMTAVDVTDDIVAEKDGHLFLYTPTNGLDASRVVIAGKDKDSKGQDVGLTFTIRATSGPAATGKLNVVLRHYDSNNKNDSVFDTDIDVDFRLVIRD
ncbi:MAG: hypothetical protein IPP94_07000 [Ignavibacteria bacterium]|nr:hypothetical protein [Ignavibacteria bacterium]